MKILVISSGYPYKTSNHFVFVKQLIDQFIILNHDITVITPQSLTRYLFNKSIKKPYLSSENILERTYNIFAPKYLTFSNVLILKNFSKYLFRRSILKTVKKEKIDFEIIYAHFLETPGTSAYKLSKKYNRKYFIALGESRFLFRKSNIIRKTLENVAGLILVSKDIENRLLNLDKRYEYKNSIVVPNGFDPNYFFKKNSNELKKKLKLTTNDFVVIFVGSLIERKGPLRLDDALKSLNNPNIKAIFIGEGPQKPNYKNIVFLGSLQHKNINDYLNISNVFVLPTTDEGSCNAIIEAIGSGTPIISSKQAFNDDILENKYSIRIDSRSIKEIAESIENLYYNQDKLKLMAENILKIYNNFRLDTRAQIIIEFIEKSLSLEQNMQKDI